MIAQEDLFRAPGSAPPARELTVLDARRRGTSFVEHGIKSVVNPPESTGMGFWSINPYVGCEFGCAYCYARYAHRYVVERARDRGLLKGRAFAEYRGQYGWQAFEQRIFVKSKADVLAAMDRDLLRVLRRRREPGVPSIVIGTATDPYQPAERQFGITRAVLERLLTTRGLSLAVITKSTLIRRDVDVLQALGQRHRLTVYVSLISTDTRVIRVFEARSPLPHARLRTLRTLRRADVRAGIIAAPVLPGITDSLFHIEALVRAAVKARAAFVQPSVLRLYPAVRQRLMPVIEQHYPNLIPRYRAAYGDRRDAPDTYVAAVQRRFRQAARKYGVAVEDPLDLEDLRRTDPQPHPQLQLRLS